MDVNVSPESSIKDEVKHHPICWKCKSSLDYRVPRGMMVKMLLFWVPLRRYYCYGCAKKRYVRG